MTCTNKTAVGNGLGNDGTWGVYELDGVIYVVTENGLSISTDGGTTFTNKTTANGLGSNVVNDVYASGGIIYAATQDGLSISTDGGATFTNKTTANGLGSDGVTDVYESGGIIYATTNGGLSICKSPLMASLSSSDADNRINIGDNVTFTAMGGTIYQFFLNDILVQNSTMATYSNNTLANGDQIKVTVRDGSGCFATSAIIMITVVGSPCVGLANNLSVNDPITLTSYKAKEEIKSTGLIASGMHVTFDSRRQNFS